ncbi:MAG TPA: 23S rRNA (adenine(2503)-C(2))-methyltransferase RlmN [Polyangiales bacterium]|nr:23S rRNA (adenine(2503)-C(2))-methyltransferase RlmN [Polyangiales bacterium]
MSEPFEIAGSTSAEFEAEAPRRLSHGAGIARQVYKDALRRGRFDPSAYGLRPSAAAAWQEQFRLSLPRVVRVASEESETGTTAKAVLALHDGLECECVLLPMGRGRSTLCVSSQIGCKMGCRFCETARMGLMRHMRTSEIVAQLLVARHVLGWEFRNVVFMGMGEALDNADNVLPALRVLADPVGLSMSQERITVCTVGNLQGIARLQELGWKRLNLSISLNAGNDALRGALMPINRKAPLAELQRVLLGFRPRANFVLGVNYCLLPGHNDTPEHAREVADFCLPLGRVMVNVIPYNPGSVPLTRAPSEAEIDGFIAQLRDHGLPVRRRITKGRTVMAACGQLGNVELRALRRSKDSTAAT